MQTMTSMCEIWWKQVGGSLRLVQAVVEHLQQEESLVLRTPKHIPWESTFEELLHRQLCTLDAGRMVRILDAGEVEEPEKFMLEELCPPDVRNRFWFNTTVAEHLAQSPALSLHQSYLWVRSIPSAAAMQKWKVFVRQYEKCAREQQLPQRAVFLLEAPGTGTDHDFPTVLCAAQEHDCRIFCMEAAAGSAMPDYLAELALRMGRQDPEACGLLLAAPDALLGDPIGTAKRLLSGARYSSGLPMPAPQEAQLHSAVLLAQIMQVFPRLEQFRLQYVQDHAVQLQTYLPIQGSQGDLIYDPQDLELGNLFFLCRQVGTNFSTEDYHRIDTCRTLRNKLAHNDLLTFEEVQAACAR